MALLQLMVVSTFFAPVVAVSAGRGSNTPSLPLPISTPAVLGEEGGDGGRPSPRRLRTPRAPLRPSPLVNPKATLKGTPIKKLKLQYKHYNVLYRGFEEILDNVRARTRCWGPRLGMLASSGLTWVSAPDKPALGTNALYSAMVRNLCPARRGSLVVEAGSLDGSQAVEAAAAGCRAVALEPSPSSFQRVFNASRQARLGKEAMQVLNVAAASSEGLANFSAHEDASAFDGLVHKGVSNLDLGGVVKGKMVEVRTQRLDVLFDSSQRIDILKVDVQGAEWDVLDGAELLLRAGNVGAILLEVSPLLTGGRFNLSRAVSRLESLDADGWGIYLIEINHMFWQLRTPEPPLCASVLLEYLASSGVDNAGWRGRWGLWMDLLFLRPGWPNWRGERPTSAKRRERRGKGRTRTGGA
eukprot:Hpha_TRINITY_DN33762_c0_g1::TRINITY_DN33762_c0_g1_i1::g.25128::m.25128